MIEEQVETVEASESRDRAGRFVKGDPRINREGKQPNALAVPYVQEEGVPEQLGIMRHVLKYPRGKGEEQGVAVVRAWLKDDPKGFMTAKTNLERALLSGRGVAVVDEPLKAEAEPEGVDEGAVLVGELIDRLLREASESGLMV